MKKFDVSCSFGGQIAKFTFYIGEPKDENHPLQNQNAWLSRNRGGTASEKVMQILSNIHSIAKRNRLSFEKTFEYAIELALSNESVQGEQDDDGSVDQDTQTSDNTNG